MGAVLVFAAGFFVVFGAATFRVIASRAFGVKGFRAAVGFDQASFYGVSWTGRGVVLFAGLIGAYLAIAILFAAGFARGGTTTTDPSLRVMVSPDGPAAHAGIANGDRIDAVNGHSVTDWDTLIAETRSHAGEEIVVRVMRDGASREFHVTPNIAGKILVGPQVVHRDVSFGAALSGGCSAPFEIWKSTLRSFVRILVGKEKAEVTGPVGIVHAANKTTQEDGLATGLRFAGAIYSYFFFVAIIFSIAMIPREKKP